MRWIAAAGITALTLLAVAWPVTAQEEMPARRPSMAGYGLDDTQTVAQIKKAGFFCQEIEGTFICRADKKIGDIPVGLTIRKAADRKTTNSLLASFALSDAETLTIALKGKYGEPSDFEKSASHMLATWKVGSDVIAMRWESSSPERAYLMLIDMARTEESKKAHVDAEEQAKQSAAAKAQRDL